MSDKKNSSNSPTSFLRKNLFNFKHDEFVETFSFNSKKQAKEALTKSICNALNRKKIKSSSKKVTVLKALLENIDKNLERDEIQIIISKKAMLQSLKRLAFREQALENDYVSLALEEELDDSNNTSRPRKRRHVAENKSVKRPKHVNL